MTCILQYNVIHSNFTALYNPWAKPIFLSFPPLEPLITIDLLTVSIVLPFPKYCIAGVIHCVAFQTNFFHWTIVVYGSFMSFHGLIVHFLLLNNIQLCACIIVCLSIHLSCLFPSSSTMNKVVMNTFMKLLYGPKFSANLSKYQGVHCWNVW